MGSVNSANSLSVPTGDCERSLPSALLTASPDIVGAFDASTHRALLLNLSGRRHLDPDHHLGIEAFTLSDLIGISSLERFRREILLQLQVLGQWQGMLDVRDAWGSEFQSQVRLVRLPPTNSEGVATIGFFASLPATTAAEDGSVTDQEMLHALLETVPDRIYFKDTKSRFLRVSRSKARKHGVSEPREIIGRTDFDFYAVDHAAKAFADEKQILTSEEGFSDREEMETHPDGHRTWSTTTKLPFYNRAGRLVGTFGISHDVTERKRAAESLRKLSQVVEQAPVSVVITDPQGRIEFVNRWFERITGYASDEAIGQTPALLKSGSHPPEFYQELWATISAGKEWSGVFANRRKSGEIFHEKASIFALRDPGQRVTHYVAVKEDVSEQRRVEAEKAEMEVRLQISQKLESVGQLAAGVAHEINTPTQFIADNLRFLRESFDALRPLLARYRSLVDLAATQPAFASLTAEITALEADQEIAYLLEEVPRTITQTQDGVRRIAKIVGSLKEFSHPSSAEKSHADLNHAIETAITVSRHEWKYVAEIVTELDPALPPVRCVLDEINQVLLNLIVNAAHAVGDANSQRGRERGRITLRTRRDGACVIIEVDDDGTGMTPEIQRRLFEPFFTTKGIGKGTGQGLGIVRNVVIKRHAGEIDLHSEPGVGTTFRLRLPIEPPAAAPSASST